MSILYQCVVANCYALNVRSGPSMSFPPVAWLQRGDTVRVDGKEGNWYKLEGQTRYCESSYLQIEKDLSPQPVVISEPPAPQSNATAVNPYESIRLGAIVGGATVSAPTKNNSVSGQKLVNIDSNNGTDNNFETVKSKNNSSKPSYSGSSKGNWGIYYILSNTNYPAKTGSNNGIPDYDFYIDHKSAYGYNSSIFELFRKIQSNLNMASFYSRETINQKLHDSFNRFRLEYPDVYLKNTMAVVIFTRPDLNLFASDGEKNEMVASDPRCNLIVSRNKKLSQLLTERCSGSESHKFNPLLSNMAQSLDVSDDSVDLLDVGETYTGYKMQYSKHNIKSITSGTFSIKYKETFDLAITNMHQLWVDYQSNVYKGIFEPKREYIYNKELDYACDVYYFLLDQDGETIKFWTKYYGVFPNNVPKSAYSFDAGSQVQFPELNVTYSYIYKEDLSPVSLVEFNENASVSAGSNQQYVKNYDTDTATSGSTWVGKPFIYSYEYNNGLEYVQGFKLGWKKS